MLCRFCGSEIPDNSEYCQVCGSVLENNVQNNNIQDNNIQNNNIRQNYAQYGNNASWQNNQQYNNASWNNNVTYQPVLPMKWFKFLTNFLMFAMVIICLYNALTVWRILNMSELSYFLSSIYVEMNVVMTLIGVLYVLCAVLIFIVRFRLVEYSKKSIKKYYLCIVFFTVLSLLFCVRNNIIFIINLWAYGSEKCGLLNSNLRIFMICSIIAILVCTIYLLLNFKYFNKRKHLFVN